MASKLRQIRAQLSKKDTDLQRLYKFNFKSVKLGFFNIDVYIVAITHPFFNFENTGDYRGYINRVTKPSEITITFLEDSKQSVNAVMELWDNFKYNKTTGIHYPKAVYEDQGTLTYLGAGPFLGSPDDFRFYVLTGLYPISRESVSLSYDNNSVETLNVTFNVDDITQGFTIF